jgi:hypothetical protein
VDAAHAAAPDPSEDLVFPDPLACLSPKAAVRGRDGVGHSIS